ncbi:cell division protein SepF [Candidatus Woesearchaeota archaeon]|nr:cell division protein SepF [Candidatus Woesearchaeota archaeon]
MVPIFPKKKKQEYEEEWTEEADYVEIGPDTQEEGTKVIVRPFVLNDFSDIKLILDTLREGYTIAIINIKPLREKDIIELKRAINKIKKTIEVIGGDIAGVGEDYIIATPSFAEIYRASSGFRSMEEEI